MKEKKYSYGIYNLPPIPTSPPISGWHQFQSHPASEDAHDSKRAASSARLAFLLPLNGCSVEIISWKPESTEKGAETVSHLIILSCLSRTLQRRLQQSKCGMGSSPDRAA
jgi:hypothetical protein